MTPGADTIQKGVGYTLTFAVAACLILAWVLTAPLLRWGVLLTDYYRQRSQPQIR
jgi:hypothetical protein